MRHIGLVSGLLALALWSSVAVAQDPIDEVLDNPTAEVEGPASEIETAAPEDPAAESDEPAADDSMADETTTDVAEEPAAIEPEEPTPLGDAEPAAEVTEEEAAGDAEITEDGMIEDQEAEVPLAEVPLAEEPGATSTDWGGIIERAPTFFAKTHHAVVHLPIALWLFGAFFVVIGAVIPSWRTQIPLACLIGGALTSVAAVASGWWYAEFDYGQPWAWGDGFGDWSDHLVQHRWYGFALAAVSIVLSIIALISQARKSTALGVFWRLGLIGLALAVAWEGHIGGELIHGEGFIEEAFQEWVSPATEE